MRRVLAGAEPFCSLRGDMHRVLRQLPDGSVDACVTDPPYELNFMGKGWDNAGVSFDPKTWEAVYRVLKPGGYLLAFGGTRTFHRIACAIEDAGFEVRDCLSWLYGCLSEDTEILVDGRWEHYSKAVPGSRVLAFDPVNETYQWETVQDQVVYDYDDTAFRVESDRTDQVVSRNHRCLVEREGRWVFQFAETLEREARVPVLEGLSELLDSLSLSHERRVRGARHTAPTVARVTPFHYVGKVWCVRVPSGAFVSRRNGKVFVTGNSGFPKSMDVSKAIDKAAGAERVKIPVTGGRLHANRNLTDDNWCKIGAACPVMDGPVPATREAAQWQGWGTALKPAWEPIIVARKPLGERTVAANVLKHGTGAMNIDGTRIDLKGDYKSKPNGRPSLTGLGDNYDPSRANQPDTVGRWPANVLLDQTAAGMLDAQTGVKKSGKPGVRRKAHETNAMAGRLGVTGQQETGYGDSGGVSRFFYVAKAGKKERNAGLPEGLENKHPTVKPISLMRWLCRLVTPPGGLVLDPFCGSGTTLCAAVAEGFRAIGVELAQDGTESLRVSRRRAAHWLPEHWRTILDDA